MTWDCRPRRAPLRKILSVYSRKHMDISGSVAAERKWTM